MIGSLARGGTRFFKKTIREFSAALKLREAFDVEACKAEATTMKPIGIRKHGCPNNAEKSIDAVSLRSKRHGLPLPICAVPKLPRCEVVRWYSALADQNNKLNSHEFHLRWVFVPKRSLRVFVILFGASSVHHTHYLKLFSAFLGKGGWPLRIWCAQCTCHTHATLKATENAMLGRSFWVVPMLSISRRWICQGSILEFRTTTIRRFIPQKPKPV